MVILKLGISRSWELFLKKIHSTKCFPVVVFCMFLYSLRNYVKYKGRGQRKTTKPPSPYNKTAEKAVSQIHHLPFIQFTIAVGLTLVAKKYLPAIVQSR